VNAKITAKQLYAGLREALAPTLRSAGFSRTRGGWLGWTRRRDSEHLTFWFQCDKWGWDPAFGSRFILEFQLGPSPVPGEGSLENRLRYDEPSPEHPIFLVEEEAQEALRAQYRPRLEPYNPRHDVWLHYFKPHDVSAWGSFLEPRILRVASDFVTRVEAGNT
jgi:hypothetical protein